MHEFNLNSCIYEKFSTSNYENENTKSNTSFEELLLEDTVKVECPSLFSYKAMKIYENENENEYKYDNIYSDLDIYNNSLKYMKKKDIINQIEKEIEKQKYNNMQIRIYRYSRYKMMPKRLIIVQEY
jgi:hypothetical protein